MKIAVFGSTGSMGKKLVEEALHNGHSVKTLVRNPQKLGTLLDHVEVIEGQYFDAVDVEETVRGTDAVLSTIGPMFKARPDDIPEKYHAGMASLVAAMKRYKLRRLILISGAGIALANESLPFKRKLLRLGLRLMGRHVLTCKQAELAVIEASDLNWTVMRPPTITEVKGKFIVDEKWLAAFKVDGRQLAAFMVSALEQREWFAKAPLAATGWAENLGTNP